MYKNGSQLIIIDPYIEPHGAEIFNVSGIHKSLIIFILDFRVKDYIKFHILRKRYQTSIRLGEIIV